MPKVTILYDNYRFAKNTSADWGFSCLIKGLEKTILFDTGAKPDILAKNIAALNIEISGIGAVVISHDHWDHTGGLAWLLANNSDLQVYLPGSASVELTDSVKSLGAETIRVKAPLQICENAWLTGEMGDAIKEQSLIVAAEKGPVVITGCSHPGIVEILRRAREIVPEKIYLAMGGFHLKDHSEEAVRNIIDSFRKIGVKKVSPSHCTGERAIALFAEHFKDNYLKIGTGYSLVF